MSTLANQLNFTDIEEHLRKASVNDDKFEAASASDVVFKNNRVARAVSRAHTAADTTRRAGVLNVLAA